MPVADGAGPVGSRTGVDEVCHPPFEAGPLGVSHGRTATKALGVWPGTSFAAPVVTERRHDDEPAFQASNVGRPAACHSSRSGSGPMAARAASRAFSSAWRIPISETLRVERASTSLAARARSAASRTAALRVR